MEGIAFKRADRVADEAYDIGADDIRRHDAGNKYILQEKAVLSERDFILERGKLQLLNPEHQNLGVDIEDSRYWYPPELEAEKGLEQWMRRLPKVGEDVPLADLSPVQQAICEKQGLDEPQTRAVRAILANKVLLLTGGAGVGKTHVIAAAVMCLVAAGFEARGMAFAGKAADRMKQAFKRYQVPGEASTIHKALQFRKGGFTLQMLGETFIFVDECSMLPNWLLWAVVSRLAPGAHLILVGDWQQLPPIGYGCPFYDLVQHGAPRIHLAKNYRQQDQQGILKMAEGVLHRTRPKTGDIEACVNLLFGVDPANFDPAFNDLIQKHGFQDFEDWQVITWKNETVERLNLMAQRIINPHGEALASYPCWKLGRDSRGRPEVTAEIRQGDKVLVVKNNTTLEVFNGQTGKAMEVVMKPKLVQRKSAEGWEIQEGDIMPHLRVEITGRLVDIPEDEIEKHLQLGYVITVHKAQGSDWPTVILAQPGKVRDDTAKKFWYTSITRAKNHLVILSDLRTNSWWQNASADFVEPPSSLMVRLERPCAFCEDSGEPCACNDGRGTAEWVAQQVLPQLDSLHLNDPATDHASVICGRCEEQFADCPACTGQHPHPDPHDEPPVLIYQDARPTELIQAAPMLPVIVTGAGVGIPRWYTLRSFKTSDIPTGPVPTDGLKQLAAGLKAMADHQHDPDYGLAAGRAAVAEQKDLERIQREFLALDLEVA